MIQLIKRIISLLKKQHHGGQCASSEMDNVVSSMFLCEPLYDQLKKKCHPDRFVEENKKMIAEDIFKRLQKAKHNYQGLKAIENDIELFLSDNQY